MHKHPIGTQQKMLDFVWENVVVRELLWQPKDHENFPFSEKLCGLWKQIDFLKNLELEATVKLHLKGKRLTDEWEAGKVNTKDRSWVIISRDSPDHDHRDCGEQ